MWRFRPIGRGSFHAPLHLEGARFELSVDSTSQLPVLEIGLHFRWDREGQYDQEDGESSHAPGKLGRTNGILYMKDCAWTFLHDSREIILRQMTIRTTSFYIVREREMLKRPGSYHPGTQMARRPSSLPPAHFVQKVTETMFAFGSDWELDSGVMHQVDRAASR